jgi:hypothetical protein
MPWKRKRGGEGHNLGDGWVPRGEQQGELAALGHAKDVNLLALDHGWSSSHADTPSKYSKGILERLRGRPGSLK